MLEHAAHHDSSRFHMEVCCVVRRGPLADAVEATGVPVHFLSRRAKFDPGAVLRLSSLLSRGRFDVVHNHNFTALSVGVPAAILAGARAVVRTEHNVLAHGDSHRRLLSRAAALRENAQIAVADAVRASHVAGRRVPAARFVTVRNGIGDARFGDGTPGSARRRAARARRSRERLRLSLRREPHEAEGPREPHPRGGARPARPCRDLPRRGRGAAQGRPRARDPGRRARRTACGSSASGSTCRGFSARPTCSCSRRSGRVFPSRSSRPWRRASRVCRHASAARARSSRTG